jgi:hypothetical protein
LKRFRLRTKFLLSLLVITAGLTSVTLLIVRYDVEKQVRNSLQEDLRNSANTYQSFEGAPSRRPFRRGVRPRESPRRRVALLPSDISLDHLRHEIGLGLFVRAGNLCAFTTQWHWAMCESLSPQFLPTGSPTWKTEQGVEFNALLDVLPMLLLQPVVQYYANVEGEGQRAVVFGFRTR